ncbi:MAG: sporulation protein, partial [Colwellia sp.]
QFEYNLTDLQVFITSTEPLPIQQRLAREQRKINDTSAKVSVLPWRAAEYQSISSPVFDLQLNTTYRRDNSSTSFSALGSHDLAYLNAKYFINSNSDSDDILSDARLTFSKESDNANLLGPLKATSVTFGDVTAISVAGSHNSHNSRGIVISNKVTHQKIENNKINFNGDILPDWDIELYRNGILLAKQLSVQNGRYEFNNIELVFGHNEFEFIMYGPQGQVETKTETAFIDKNVLNAAQSSYEMSLTQPNKSLLGIERQPSTEIEDKNFLFSSQYNLGVTDWFSFSLGQEHLFVDNDSDKQDFALLTNLTLTNSLLIGTVMTINQDYDRALGVNARTAIFGHSLSYQYSQTTLGSKGLALLRLDSPEVQSDIRSHSVQMTGQLYNNRYINAHYQNRLSLSEDYSGERNTLFSNQLGINTGKFSIQNSLSWADNNIEETLFGSLSLHRKFNNFSTRLSSQYRIKPTGKIDNVTADISWPIKPGLQSELSLDYSPITDDFSQRLALNWQHSAFNVNTTISHDANDNWVAGLSFRFTFGYQIDQEKFFINANPMTSDGSLMVRVFEDKNLNNKFDQGEKLIEGAKIKSIQNFRQAKTDDDGFALLNNMPVGLTTDIELDTSNIQDSFLIPTMKGIAITPRAAFVEYLDFPVVSSGEVEGIVYLKDENGKEVEQAFVLIHLINEQGDIVATTQTEYDGYYLFSDILPGKYKASIDKKYLEQKKFRVTDDLQLLLTAQGDIINGSDFNLERLEFTSGFVAHSRSFNSLNMLKTYWYLIKKRNRQLLKQKPFYIFDKETSKFQLNLGFYKKIEQATTDCDKVVKLNVNCSVNEFTFGR